MEFYKNEIRSWNVVDSMPLTQGALRYVDALSILRVTKINYGYLLNCIKK